MTATSAAPPLAATTARRLSERHPWVYPWAVRAHRLRRRLRWWLGSERWTRSRAGTDLPTRVHRHSSLLMRELAPDEMWLQRNKVVNLRLAATRVDDLLIGPGETFSFNRVVGNCTTRKGYVDGMRLHNGAATSGVGGGICQLANLLHWMFLHSPLTVVERSEHSFDPFPDKQRVLPWGVGCSIVYNYVDLVVRNDTAVTFQLRAWVGELHLHGELRADQALPLAYSVSARGERFLRRPDGVVLRSNEIWRKEIDRRTGDTVADSLVKRNCAIVRYDVPEELITGSPAGPAANWG